MRLLLFDDQEEQLTPIRDALQKAWRGLDYERDDPLSIDAFPVVDDAIAALQGEPFDMVLADTVAPDADDIKSAKAGAWRIYEFLKQNPEHRPANLVFVAMTSSPDAANVLRDIDREQIQLLDKRWAFALQKPQRIGVAEWRSGIPNQQWYFFVISLMKRYREVEFRKSLLTGPIAQFAGISARGQAIRAKILQASAENRMRVFLVSGERGTGKEVVARMIHDERGFPPDRPPVTLDCSDPQAVQTIFGSYQHAATGAHQAMAAGLCQGPTIILDNFDPDIQSEELRTRIVRLIRERTFLKVGSEQPEAFDGVLVIGSSQPINHHEMFEASGNGAISLAAVLHLPALRDVREDIPAILAHVWKRTGAWRELTQDTLRFLAEEYSWPGNHAQLGRFVEEANLKSKVYPFVEPDEAAEIVHSLAPSSDYRLARKLADALRSCGGNKSQAALMVYASATDDEAAAERARKRLEKDLSSLRQRFPKVFETSSV